MNSFTKSAILAAALACISGLACADTYSLSGTFDTTSYPGPLNGGSFSGTYDFANGSFGSFDIFLRDAGGSVLAEISSASGGAAVLTITPNDASLARVQFSSDSSYTNLLVLNFNAPFTGAGAVQTGSGNYISFANVGGYAYANVSAVAGGMAVAVPEPATWGLMGLGLFAVGAISRRRKG